MIVRVGKVCRGLEGSDWGKLLWQSAQHPAREDARSSQSGYRALRAASRSSSRTSRTLRRPGQNYVVSGGKALGSGDGIYRLISHA